MKTTIAQEILTPQFIEKRIKEQNEELENIAKRFSNKEINYVRFTELYKSAQSQLIYFLDKQDLLCHS